MEYLKILWGLRKDRETEFAEILVALESAIKYYDVSELTIIKVDVLSEIFYNLKSVNLLTTFPKECRKKLREAGFDLMRPVEMEPAKEFVAFLEQFKKI